MRWNSRPTRRPHAKTQRSRRLTKLHLEALEDRITPTIDANALFQGIGRDVQAFGNALTSTLRQSDTILPIITQPLSSLENDVRSAITSIKTRVENLVNNVIVINALNGGDRQTAAQAIQDALGPFAQNVQVPTLQPANDTVGVVMDLVQPLVSRTVPLGTGLPALPVQLGQANLQLDSALRYDKMTFGLNQGNYFFDANAADDELKLTLNTGLLPGATFDGEIGFLAGSVEVIEDGVGLTGSLAADVTPNGVASPRFVNLHAGADLRLTAEFAKGGAEAGISMPKFRTDFHLDWDLSGSSPTAGLASLGATPRVSFDNVSIGLGTLLTQSIGPVVKTIQQLSAPIQPVLDLLDAPIPGLSDVGLGKVNLLKLAKLAQSADALPPHLQLLTKIALEVATLHAYVSRITIPGGEVYVNLGNYSLTGANGGADLRQVVQKARNLWDFGKNPNLSLTDLKGVLQSAALTFKERVNAIRDQLPDDLQQPLTDLLDQSGFMNKIDALGNGVKLIFPVVEDPVQGAIKLLLGQADQVKFVEFTADLNASVPTTELLNFPVWGPVRGNATGSIDFELHFGVRYDAKGLSDFLAKMFHPRPRERGVDPKLFANGLAFDSRTSNPFADFKNDLIHITANIGAGAYLPFPIGAVMPGPLGFPVTAEVRVGPAGSLGGHLGLRLTDPTPGDGVIRPLEASPGNRPEYLFEADGRLDAAIKLLVEGWLGPVKLATLYERPLVEKNLFNSEDIDKSNPFRPPAQWSFGGAPTVAQWFDVKSNGGRQSGAPNEISVRQNGDQIEVHVNGALRRSYPRLETSSLTLFGTMHDDNFVVRSIPIDVTVIGGGIFQGSFYVRSGFDTLTMDDRVPWLVPQMTYTVSADRVRASFFQGDIENPRDVIHAAIDDIRLITPSRLNAVNVNDLPAVPFTIQTTPLFVSPSSGWNRLATYDPYDISSTFPSVNLITVTGAALNRQGANLTIDGRSGADFVTIRENIFTTITDYTVNNDRVIRQGSDGDFVFRTGTVRYRGTESLAIVDEWGGALGRTYRVVGLDPATPVSITGGGGPDEVILGQQLDALSGSDVFHIPTLTLNGGGGVDRLVLDDSLSTDAASVVGTGAPAPTRLTSPVWSVNGPSISRTNTVHDLQLGTSETYYLSLNSGGFESVDLAGSGGQDTYTVTATVPGQPLHVFGAAGNDTLIVGPFTVDGVTGPLSFDGGAGDDRLAVLDSLAPGDFFFGNWYTLYADRVIARARTVGYARVEDLDLTTSSYEDRVVVQGVPAGATLDVATGPGDDEVIVGHDDVFLGGAGLSQVLGDIQVKGGTGFDTLVVSDRGQPAGQTFGVSNHDVAFGAGVAAAYQDVETVQVTGGAGDDNFHLGSGTFSTPIDLDGGGGQNMLKSADGAAATFRLTGQNAGSIYGNVAFGSVQSLRGTGADDSFVFAPGARLDGDLDGTGGSDTLDYSEFVTVYPGLISQWKAEGDASDSIGGHDGVLTNGVTFVPGQSGQAFEFDGANEHVRVANHPDLEPTNVTVEAWVKASYPGITGYLVSKGASGDTAASYALYTGATGGLFFYIFDGTTFVLSPDAGTRIWNGDWHHVVGTYDGSAVHLYVDGAEVGEGSFSDLNIGYDLPSSNDLLIGTYDSTSRDWGYRGSIDEVSVYNRALSAAEVASRYHGGTPVADGGIYANLQTHRASGVGGSVSNVHNVVGSAGNDILVGDGGNTLRGGAGRDLLIAGALASLLDGGTDDDLLIGGTTNYDQNDEALAAILTEWTRTDLDYAARVSNLVNGQGVPTLDSTTIQAHGGTNQLTGGLGQDLFFAALASELLDRDGTEQWVPLT